jgi:hypothetical protein
LALGCGLDNIIVIWRTGSKSEPIGESSVFIKEIVQRNVPSCSFTKNGETCGHKTKEGKKVIVDAVAMQRRRKTIVTSPPSYLINFNFCCYLHWNTVLSSNYSRNYHWELILVFVRVKCG